MHTNCTWNSIGYFSPTSAVGHLMGQQIMDALILFGVPRTSSPSTNDMPMMFLINCDGLHVTSFVSLIDASKEQPIRPRRGHMGCVFT